jgi:hypothetical protein
LILEFFKIVDQNFDWKSSFFMNNSSKELRGWTFLKANPSWL